MRVKILIFSQIGQCDALHWIALGTNLDYFLSHIDPYFYFRAEKFFILTYDSFTLDIQNLTLAVHFSDRPNVTKPINRLLT